MLTFLATVLEETLAQIRARRDREERAAIAKAFNDRYCYRRHYVRTSTFLPGTAVCLDGYRWMCPSCNQIKAPTECTIFTGLSYPACCSTPEGHRLNQSIQIT